jgi:hypothetical protein
MVTAAACLAHENDLKSKKYATISHASVQCVLTQITPLLSHASSTCLSTCPLAQFTDGSMLLLLPWRCLACVLTQFSMLLLLPPINLAWRHLRGLNRLYQLAMRPFLYGRPNKRIA